jgi:hypothetical protein
MAVYQSLCHFYSCNVSFLGLGGGLLGRFWRYTLTIILEYENLSLEHLLFPVTVHYALLEEVRGLLLDFADLFDDCSLVSPNFCKADKRVKTPNLFLDLIYQFIPPSSMNNTTVLKSIWVDLRNIMNLIKDTKVE